MSDRIRGLSDLPWAARGVLVRRRLLRRLGPQRRYEDADKAAQRRRRVIHPVEAIAPEDDLPVLDVEAAADPELDPQSSQLQHVGAFGQDRVVGGGVAWL